MDRGTSAVAHTSAGDRGAHAEWRHVSAAASAACMVLGRIFVIAIALFTFMCLALTVYHPAYQIVSPVDEHRTPAAFPTLSLSVEATGDFASRLNLWFDDRVSLRDLFIRSKNQIDYSVFDTSRKVYVGRDGWLFERATTDSRLRLEQASADELIRLENAFLKLADQLRRRGIRLIVVGYPDKSMLYPEMLPAAAPVIPRGGNYDKLRAFLAQTPALTFIDAEEILEHEKSKSTEPLFFKTDIHVDLAGDIPVVKTIIDRIAQLENRSDIHWSESLDFRHTHWAKGIEGRFLSVLRPIHERILYAANAYLVGQDEPAGRWNVPDPRAVDQVGNGNGLPFDYEFELSPQLCNQRLPGMVLFGNSFSDLWWNLGLHHYFCFMRRARTPIERLPAFVDSIPPGTKYLIFQYLAAYLPGEGPWLR